MTSIIFMGTPDFAVPILQGLVQASYQVLAVVTQPDRPVGRRRRLTASPVKKAALDLNIPVYQPEKLPKSADLTKLINLKPDLIITAAYGQFLPKKLLKAVKIKALNVHASLLPKYRGGAPIQRALMAGEKQTGVTILEMVAKMDAGGLFSQKIVSIAPDDDTGSLFAKLSLAGRDLLLKTLPKIIAGTMIEVPQADEDVTFAPNIKATEAQLNLQAPASELVNKVRALRPDPIAYLYLNEKRTRVLASHVADLSTSLSPGAVVKADKKNLWLAAGSGSVWALDQLQVAGKKPMAIAAFMNGYGQDFIAGQNMVVFHED